MANFILKFWYCPINRSKVWEISFKLNSSWNYSEKVEELGNFKRRLGKRWRSQDAWDVMRHEMCHAMYHAMYHAMMMRCMSCDGCTFCLSSRTVVSVMATTEQVRGSPVIRLNSPKISPTPSSNNSLNFMLNSSWKMLESWVENGRMKFEVHVEVSTCVSTWNIQVESVFSSWKYLEPPSPSRRSSRTVPSSMMNMDRSVSPSIQVENSSWTFKLKIVIPWMM